LDVGGTKIAGLRVRGDGEILDRRTVATPATDQSATVEALVDVARGLVTADVAAVGVGAAGIVDVEGVVRFSPNLSYRDLALAPSLRRVLDVPCLVDNDANVAAWGEFVVGAGRDVDDMMLVTVGTGIGGGIVSGRRLFHGAHGFAAEIGHIIVEPGGPRCGCGNLGCWEQVASGSAMRREGARVAAADPTSAIARLADGRAGDVTGSMVTQAAQGGDATAVAILAEVGRRLGEGIAGLVNVLDPAAVVVGGGAMEAGDLLLEPARRAFEGAVEAPERRPAVPILAAALGNDAGGVGAALLALQAAAEPAR
jgi:glucokinase